VDRAQFEVELVDKASGPAAKAAGGARELSSALGNVKGATVEVTLKQTKLDRALKGAQIVYYGAQAAEVGKRVWDAAGGFEGLKRIAGRAGQALVSFGRSAGVAAKRVAPFAVGGAGLYGMAKVASGVAVPALGGVALGIAGITAAAAAATVGVGLLAAKLAALSGGALLKFAQFGQDTKFAMGNLAKGGASADKMFTHAAGLASEFGLDVKATTKQWTKFLALQFKPKEADKMIKMGADLQALGTSAEQVEGVFMALGQIKGKGRLQAEEMLQLAERGISTVLVVEEIGKILGKTNDEVRKLQEAGKVSADVGLQAIERAINRKLGQKELGESGKRFANETITGLIGQIKARGQLVGIALGEKLVPSVSRVTQKVLSRFEDFISSDRGQKVIDRLGGTFDRLGDIAIKAMPLVEAFMEGFTDRGIEAIEGLNKALGAAGSADGKAAAETVKAIGQGMADIVIYGGAALSAIAGLTGAVVAALGYLGPEVIMAIGNPFVALPVLAAEAGRRTADVVLGWVPRMKQVGTDLIAGLAEGIRAGIMAPVNAIGEVGEAVIAKARAVWDSHSPSRVGRDIGYTLPQGQAVGIRAGGYLPIAAAAGIAAATITAAERQYDMGPMLSSSRADSSFGGAAGFDFGDLRGGGSFVFRVTQNIDGGGDAEEAAELSERRFRRMADDYFRSMGMEG
jgi:tape measure domain-containing protein